MVLLCHVHVRAPYIPSASALHSVSLSCGRSGSEGPLYAADQADTCFPEDPPQYKHITEITWPARHHRHWPVNQDHIVKKRRESTSSAQHRKCTQLTSRQWIKFNQPHMCHFHGYSTLEQ